MDRKLTRTAPAWWRNRYALIAIALILIAVAIWRILPARGSTDVAADDLRTGRVEQAAFDDYLPTRATVVPATTTLVGVMSGGQVEELMVQDGDVVTKNQLLAQLTNPELRLQVLSQEAQIASQLGGVAGENLGIQRARADRAGQVSQAEYDLIRARRDLDIRQQLHDKGFVSDAGVKSYQEQADYQSKRLAQLRSGQSTEVGITAKQAALLNATRARLQNNLAAVRGSLDALSIRAPTGGRLTNFTLQPGQTLSPGDPAGQVDSEGDWKLEADVDEYYLGRVKVGQTAATSDGARLRVSSVLPTVSDGRFRVELTFETMPRETLNRGQTLDVKITLSASSEAVVAPVGGWLSKSGSNPFLLDESGAFARRTPVKIGRRNPRQVEIISGLKPGQRIVTSELPEVEGDVINIR